jgi:hypothetical protein
VQNGCFVAQKWPRKPIQAQIITRRVISGFATLTGKKKRKALSPSAFLLLTLSI